MNSKDADGIVIDNNGADCFGDENHDPYDISRDNIDVCWSMIYLVTILMSVEQFTDDIDNIESDLSEINVNDLCVIQNDEMTTEYNNIYKMMKWQQNIIIYTWMMKWQQNIIIYTKWWSDNRI